MRLHCPECGTELTGEAISLARGEAVCASCGRVGQLPDLMPTPPGPPERQRPSETEVVVQRHGPGEIALFIPSGSRAFSLGFAAFWNLFMAVFTVVVLTAGGVSEAPWFLIPFLGLFWAIGIGLLVVALFSVFGKTLVHIGGGEVAVKKELFGLGRLHRYPLAPDAKASLAESYRENDVPVYACCVSTAGTDVKFGTFLTSDEKSWLVSILNDVLGARGPMPVTAAEGPRVCPRCRRTLEGELLSPALRLARCPDCEEVYHLDELAAPGEKPPRAGAPVDRPAATKVDMADFGSELRIVLPPLISTRLGKVGLLLFALFGVTFVAVLSGFTIAALREGRMAVVVVLPFWVFVLVALLGGLRLLTGRRGIIIAEGEAKSRRALLGLGRWKTHPLPSRPRVVFGTVEGEAPDRVVATVAAFAPLQLKYEGGILNFGYHLSPEEKRWLTRSINDFLARQ